MTTDFFIKRRDQLPEITATLVDSSDPPQTINLGGCSVRFIMTNKTTDEVAVDAPATIVDAVNGKVKYSWQPPDTDTDGNFKAEFEVTFGDGRAETFPNNKNIIIKITPDLGGVSL